MAAEAPEAAAPPCAYSLWLCPQEGSELSGKLTDLISKLAERFKGPKFAPHVTLLGGAPKGTEEAACEAARQLAEALEPFEVAVPEGGAAYEAPGRPAGAGANYRAFAVEGHCQPFQTPELLAANALARERLHGAPPGEASFSPPSRRPHLSLLYGEHPAEERASAVAFAASEAPFITEGFAFRADALHLWASAPGGFKSQTVEEWRWVASFPLGSVSTEDKNS